MTTNIRPRSGIFALLQAVRNEIRRRRVYHATLSELRSLSQRQLEDRGISRNMISRLAAEAAWGKRN